MNDKAECKRTGVCCSKLYVHSMLRISKVFLKRSKRKHYPNTKPAISKAWIEDATKAEDLGLSTFPCRFLTGDNECSLQDKKPEVCSHTLSQKLVEGSDSQELLYSFFHHKCGYLTGAPDIFIRYSRILEEQYKINTKNSWKNYRRWWSLEYRRLEIQEYPQVKGWSIKNKKWVQYK